MGEVAECRVNGTIESPNVLAHVKGCDRTVVAVFEPGRATIVELIAEVLGRPALFINNLTALDSVDDSCAVVGICATQARDNCHTVETLPHLVINTHCITDNEYADDVLTAACDYEFCYNAQDTRRDLTRFLTHVVGQSKFHDKLLQKARTYMISTTFPDIRVALPNLDILTMGADAVELRVDLLRDPLAGGESTLVPSIAYVAEQTMLLRQSTELPIIFTTRCSAENGRFPMDNPELFYDYHLRAIKWGVEYVDVELWLPEKIRQRISAAKGHSKIISAFHDFSGAWEWQRSEQAQKIFWEGERYGDVVKMNVMVNSAEQNYHLEVFRSIIKSASSKAIPPLSAVNMGPLGQVSRGLNPVFSPVTHPLLPVVAAPGQVSVRQINQQLHAMGHLLTRHFYAAGKFNSNMHALFQKCIKELSLPHSLTVIDRKPEDALDMVAKDSLLGGAYFDPPLPSNAATFPTLSNEAKAIKYVDTMAVQNVDGHDHPIGLNVAQAAIRACLTRDFVPSAYQGRTAIVLAGSVPYAAAAIFALQSLKIGMIYTAGFKDQGLPAEKVQSLTSVESVNRVKKPFVIVSTLHAEKSPLVRLLLRHYAAGHHNSPRSRGRVFLDLASGADDTLRASAIKLGWTTHDMVEISSWMTVIRFRELVGENIPYDFVRSASGRQL